MGSRTSFLPAGWFFLNGNGTGLTPCIRPPPFLEFLFCSFRRRRGHARARRWVATLGSPARSWALEKAGRAAASRLPVVGLVEAKALLGLHQFSCLHYFFL